MAPTGPLSITAAPLPAEAGLIVPERVKVGPFCTAATKFTPATSLLVITAACVVGLKPKPVALGVTAYVPADKPEKLYVPLLLAVVVAVAAPLNDKVVVTLGAGFTVPEMAKVV